MRQLYLSYKAALPDSSYNAWAHTNKNICFVSRELRSKPLISVIVPVYNTPQFHLLEMVYSVINQHYENWEMIIVNASTTPASRQQVKACADIDIRIKVAELDKNLGISANTNAGIKHASGEYIAFFDHDDVLHPCALHSAVEALRGSQPVDIVYTDEDKITHNSDRYFGPHCKPDWSPDLLRNVNYINHLTLIKTDMVKGVGGLRPAYDGAQDYDLLLRIIDKYQPRVVHVPRILYHWRAAESSTAQNINTKTYIFQAGVKALGEHLKRNRIAAKATIIAGKPGFYRVEYKPVDFSIIIGQVSPSKEQACAKWLTELFEKVRFDGVQAELIIGKWYQKFAQSHTLPIPVKFVSTKKTNYWLAAAKQVSYPVTVCFKTAALPEQPLGLVQLAAVAADPGHTAASPIIVSENDTIFDAGIIGSDYLPRKLFEGYILGRYTYFGNTDWVRNVSDLTTNIVAMGTKRFRQFVEHGIQSYQRADTMHSLLPATMIDKSRFVVWAHTPFEYKGVLKPAEGGSYQNSQLFRFTPVITMHVDNWGESYAKASET